MALSVKGKIDKILNPESGVSRAGNQWNKQEFVIETDEQFSKKVCFTLFGDKTSLIEGLNPGEEVEVSFNLESREFNGKWFHNINAWKIDKSSENQTRRRNHRAGNQTGSATRRRRHRTDPSCRCAAPPGSQAVRRPRPGR